MNGGSISNRSSHLLRLMRAGLHEYDDLQGIQWEWQAVDGVMRHPPLSPALRPEPTPLIVAKSGTKRSLLTDGAGIPLALVVDGANRHDVKLLSATLDGLVISRPKPTEVQPQHLCLDAAYDSTPVYGELLARHDHSHVSSRGEEKREKEIIAGYRARRWVVERSHSWINRSRRLLVRSREKSRELSGFSPSSLCSTHLCENSGSGKGLPCNTLSGLNPEVSTRQRHDEHA